MPPSTPTKKSSHRPSSSSKDTEDAKRLRSYQLSTVAWRQKARWPGRFRLLDLPAELRNRIYELALLQQPYRVLDFTDRNNLVKLPPLLYANDQLFAEAGDLYLSRMRFEIICYHSHSKGFRLWLKRLGSALKQALVVNPNVAVRIIHNCYDHRKARHVNNHDLLGWYGIRMAHEMDGAQDVSVASRSPLARWLLTSECASITPPGQKLNKLWPTIKERRLQTLVWNDEETVGHAPSYQHAITLDLLEQMCRVARKMLKVLDPPKGASSAQQIQ